MDAEEHRALVDRATRGDAPAIAVLLERHLSGLELYVRLHAGVLLRGREETQDLCQSVCREVLEHASSFEYRGEAAFRGWLFAQALGKIRDRQRYWLADKRHVGREHPPSSAAVLADLAAVAPSFATPSQVAIREEDLCRLEAAFAQLPDEHRRVISMAKLAGLSHAEIAAELGKSEEACRALLHRAVARLGLLMGEGDARGA